MGDDDVATFAFGEPHVECAAELVAAGLWAGDGESGWTLVENGLWTLDPDNEPDVFGDGPDAFDVE